MERRYLSKLIAPSFYGVHRDIRRRGHGEYWLAGGRGSGKSSFLSIELLLEMLRNREANAVVFRRVGATVRESVFEQVLWAAQVLGAADCFRPRLTPLEIEYRPTGQKVLFRGADDPGKTKSIKLARGYFGCLWFEEATEFPGMETIRSIKASVARGGETTTFLSYNPPASMGSWVNQEAAAGGRGRMVHRSDYRSVPREWLGEGFFADAEELRRRDERAYRHMYLGEAVGYGAQVFSNVEIRRISPEEAAGCDRIYCGLDFGFAVDPDAFVRLHYDRRRGEVLFLEEYWGVRTPMERLAEEIRGRMEGAGCVTCDSADPRMIEEMRRRGLRAVGARKGPGSVERGTRQLQEMRKIVIDPEKCPNAAREFSTYEYLRGKDGEVLAAYPDRNNHTIDAARYALEQALTRREARPVSRQGLGI